MKRSVFLRPKYEEHSLSTLLDLAVIAEECGFDSIYLPESWGDESFILLAAIAARTNNIGLGTAIVNPFSRTPALLAMALNTLRGLYPQRRLTLGLGASTRAIIENWHGVPFYRPVTRLAESMEIVRAALQSDCVDYRGEIFQLEGMRLRAPLAAGDVRILSGAVGPKSIERTAAVADGWLPYLYPFSALREGMREFSDCFVRLQPGRGTPHVAAVVPAIVSATSDRAERVLRRHVSFYLGAMGPHYQGLVARHGHDAVVASISSHWNDGARDDAARAVTRELLEDVGVWGDESRARERLDSIDVLEHVDETIFLVPQFASIEDVRLTLQALGPA